LRGEADRCLAFAIYDKEKVNMQDTKTGKFKRLPKEKKPVDRSLSLQKAFEEASDVIDTLADEYAEWYDNMTGTSLAAMEKYGVVREVSQVMEEQFDALEGLEFPDGIGEIPIIIPLYPSGKSPSKSVRLSYACQVLSSICSAIIDDVDADSAETSIFNIIEDAEQKEDAMEQAEEFTQELQEIIDALDSIDFP